MKSKKMKPQGRLIKSRKRNIQVKGKWKSIEIDPSLFAEEGMEGLVCFEELTNYRLVDSEKAAVKATKEQEKGPKKKAQKRKASDVETGDGEATEASGETAETPKKKAKKKKVKKIKDDSTEDTQEDDKEETKSELEEQIPAISLQDSESKPNKKKKKKKSKQEPLNEPTTEEQPAQEATLEDQAKELDKVPKSKPTKPPKEQIKNWTSAALSGCEDTSSDMSAWKDLYVPAPVLKALSSLGFSSPTPIQALALPSAIRDRMDILGAAETGEKDLP